MFRTVGFMGLIAVAVTLLSCGAGEANLGGTSEKGVTPELTIHYYGSSKAKTLTVDAGAFVDLEYTWRVGADFEAPDADLRAFVHFRDSEGNLIEYEPSKTFQDDHDIYPAPKNWKPGEPVVYTREMFKIPESIGGDNYEVTAVVGLYDPKTNRRAQLFWPGAQPNDRAYEVTRFNVRKNRKIFPHWNESWHGPEPPDYTKRWSKRESSVTFERDRKAKSVELVIAGHSPSEELEGDQLMRIYLHKKDPEFLVDELTFARERINPTRIAIKDDLYNHEEFKKTHVRVIFELDPILRPTNEPRTELGFLFHDLLLLPRDLKSRDETSQ